MDSDGLSKIIVPRGERFIHAGGRGVRVATARTQVVLLNGKPCRATVDASGRVTHVETADGLHAVARPRTISMRPVVS